MSWKRTASAAALAAATLGVLTAPQSAAAPAAPRAPGDRPVASLLKELQGLYERTEAASEAYNATAERLDRQKAETKKAEDALREARSALRDGRSRAGELARRQYQGSGAGIPSSVQLLLSRDPRAAMEHGRFLKRAAGSQASTVKSLTRGEAEHARTAQRAEKSLERQRKLAGREKAKRDAVRERLDEVESLLSSLSDEQLAELRRLEARQMDSAQRELVGSGALGASRPPSAGGAQALRYAVDQVGKPYVWGAEGPDSFDCSGLSSQAWKHAADSGGEGSDRAGGGTAIPRTSQEQWKRLDRVPLNRLRPGDLVIYFPGATHVAVYAGDGKVVQAPRPGAKVKVSPIAANPVLGAVRPDPGAPPLAHYEPPQLPAGAGDGGDGGFGSASVPG